MSPVLPHPRPIGRLRKNYTLAVIFGTLACLSSTGIVPGEEIRRARYLMGTRCTARTHHPDERAAGLLLDAALDEIARAEALLSTWRDDTELARLNRTAAHASVEVSEDLAGFLTLALAWARETRGAFDPTVGALVDAYDLRGAGRFPSEDELRKVRRSTGWRKVRLRGTRARLISEGLWIDPGGIGKGWAMDRAAETLRAARIESALLDCGGQILAIGAPPGAEGWTVAVADPRRREEPVMLLELRDASVATSGLSERSPRAGGRRIGHVLDPRTGRPVETDAAVTVIASTGAEADALSTALLVMGPGKGLRWVQGRRGIEAGWLIPEEDRLELTATEGFRRLRLPTQTTGHLTGEHGSPAHPEED